MRIVDVGDIRAFASCCGVNLARRLGVGSVGGEAGAALGVGSIGGETGAALWSGFCRL
jgi:hypothetical protein